jgi:hypothetical protein
MLFPTVDFAIFFALVFLGHWLLNPRPMVWKLFPGGTPNPCHLCHPWKGFAFRLQRAQKSTNHIGKVQRF